MYNLLIKIMVGAALLQSGISLSEFKDCHSRDCLRTLERKSRKVLAVDWKPLSVFPAEARRWGERSKPFNVSPLAADLRRRHGREVIGYQK